MKFLYLILACGVLLMGASTVSAQDEKADESKDKPKISETTWKKIGAITKQKRSFQVEKATTVAGVRGAEAEDEVLKHLYYRGGTKAPNRLELKNAIEILEKDVKLNPEGEDLPESLFFIGQCYEELNQPDDARDAYRRLIKERPDSDFAKQAKERIDALPK